MSNLKVHLVAIAKNEELYIEDWMLYYFNLGIDFIYIYDNNDINKKPSLSEFLSNSNKLKDYKDKYLIIKWQWSQNDAYKNCWNNFSNDFDWLMINDIDEFIDLNGCSNAFFKQLRNEEILETDYEKYTNIKQLLENYKNNKLVSLKWIEYGDNEIIQRDMSESAYEAFNNKSCYTYEKCLKSCFNKHLIKNFKTICGHVLLENNKIISNSINNEETNSWRLKYPLLENEPFIRHFRTYSLKEYLDQKYRVKHQQCLDFDIRRYLLSLYYFKINQWTEQKQKYIEEYRKKNNIVRTLYVCDKETYKKYGFLKNKCCYVYGKPFENINKLKNDYKFQGINQLIEIIYDFDYIVFL